MKKDVENEKDEKTHVENQQNDKHPLGKLRKGRKTH